MVSPSGAAVLSYQPAPELAPQDPLIAVEERQLKNLIVAVQAVDPRIRRAFMIELLGQDTVDNLQHLQRCDAQVWHSKGCARVNETVTSILNKIRS